MTLFPAPRRRQPGELARRPRVLRAAGEIGGSALATVRADHVGALLEMAAAAAGAPPSACEAAARGARAAGGAPGTTPEHTNLSLKGPPLHLQGRRSPC